MRLRIKFSKDGSKIEVVGVDGAFVGKHTSSTIAPFNSATQRFDTPYPIFSIVDDIVRKKETKLILIKLTPVISYRRLKVLKKKETPGFEIDVGPFKVKSPNLTGCGWEVEGETFENVEDAVWKLYVCGISKNKTSNIKDLSRFCDWWVSEINKSFSPMGVEVSFEDHKERRS